MTSQLFLVPVGEQFDGSPVMEINTAKWELNLRLLEMAHVHSKHLLCNQMQRMVKATSVN